MPLTEDPQVFVPTTEVAAGLRGLLVSDDDCGLSDLRRDDEARDPSA